MVAGALKLLDTGLMCGGFIKSTFLDVLYEQLTVDNLEVVKMGKLLFLKPKMGIVPELSIQNYDTLAKQIREVVSNSLDANAKNVHISLLFGTDSADLMIEDDGDGMDMEGIENEFLALGGSNKFFDKTKIGRIGIGFLAVVPLCKTIEIQTRKKGSDTVLVAELDCKKLMLEELRTKTIKEIPVGRILDEINDADKRGYAANPHFTKIKLIGVKPVVVKSFKDENKLMALKEDLRKILPLEYDPNSRIFNHISEKLKEDLIQSAKDYSVKVFLNSNEPLTRRTYGDHKDEAIYAIKEFKKVKVDDMKIIGYFIRKESSEGMKSHELKKWDGLIVRVQNVAVVDSGFLGFEGRDERKRRVCGDISIIGIDKNKAITIDRSDFKEDDPQFQEIKNFIFQELNRFFDGLNFDWEVKTELNKTIGVAVKLGEAMEKASRGISKLKDISVEKPGEDRRLKNYKKIKLIDTSEIRNKFEKLRLMPEKGLTSKKRYKIVWDDITDEKGEIKIDDQIFDKQKWDFEIEGETYGCEFVDGAENATPCEYEPEHKEFYLNRNNRIIRSLKPEFILLCILVEYCKHKTKTKEEFTRKLFDLMEGLVR